MLVCGKRTRRNFPQTTAFGFIPHLIIMSGLISVKMVSTMCELRSIISDGQNVRTYITRETQQLFADQGVAGLGEFLKLDNVCKIFKVGTLLSRVVIPAVWRISLSLPDTPFVFSLVGESGSGKTTLANIILRILKPTSGKIYLHGRNLDEYPKKEFLKRVQPIFQNPFETFNP